MLSSETGAQPDAQPARIPVAVSARHVHLTHASVERLFGVEHALLARRPVGQPDQFATEETVTLIGPKGRLEHVRIVGPERHEDQVEVSQTDAIALGIDAPVRESGDIDHTPGLVLEGPNGRVTLKRGVICALRHLHMNPATADVLNIKDKDRVELTMATGPRRMTFGDVLVRVSSAFRLEFHVDTDEANASGLHTNDEVLLYPRPPP
jgi:acetate kinase